MTTLFTPMDGYFAASKILTLESFCGFLGVFFTLELNKSIFASWVELTMPTTFEGFFDVAVRSVFGDVPHE
jgi:hypothetical protein